MLHRRDASGDASARSGVGDQDVTRGLLGDGGGDRAEYAACTLYTAVADDDHAGREPLRLFAHRGRGVAKRNGGGCDPIVRKGNAQVVQELLLNTKYLDGCPAQSPDSLNLFMASNRLGGLGGLDIWMATRASVNDPWSTPVNLGPAINTALDESRPFLSSDAEQLLFGRTGPTGTGEGGTGATDIYVTTRVNGLATPFTGTWVGNDPGLPDGDGSIVHLTITGGSNPVLEFTDEFGSICVNAGSSVTEFTSRLTGSVDGSTLNATFRNARCGSVALHFLVGERFSLELDDQGNNDPSDDTLFDGSVVWSRA